MFARVKIRICGTRYQKRFVVSKAVEASIESCLLRDSIFMHEMSFALGST